MVMAVAGVVAAPQPQRPFPTTPATDRARTEALARRANDRLQALRAEADRLAAEARTLVGDLRKLEIERQIKTQELAQIAADQAALEQEVVDLDAEGARLNDQARAELPILRQRIVDLYKIGSASPLRLLLATNDFRQLGRASRTVAALSTLDQRRIATHHRRLQELDTTRASLDDRRARLATLATHAEQARNDAARAIRDRDSLVRQIDARRDLTAALTGELQAAQQRLQALLKSPGGTPVVLPLRPFQGELDWPAAGPVRVPFDPGRGLRPNGVDIAGPEGRPVRAIHEGTVAFAGPFEGYGTLIIVEHDTGNFSLYGDLLDLAVAQGARLDRGQVLGTTGVSPTGLPGLYFELRIDGRPVNPLQWLRRR
jgi:septal ring factor EnvC (AmiA/AmiB activator)